MTVDAAEVRIMKRKRATILKLIRQGHERQRERMDDFDVHASMQDIWRMSPNQVLTMLQDLCVFGYIRYRQQWSDEKERMQLFEIELTPQGTALVTRQQSNDEVLFD